MEGGPVRTERKSMKKTKPIRSIAFIAVLIALGWGVISHGMHLYKTRVFKATKKILPAYVGEYIDYDEFANEQLKKKHHCMISMVDTPANDMNYRDKLISRIVSCDRANLFTPGFDIGLRDRNKKGNWKVYWIERSFDTDEKAKRDILNVIEATFGKPKNNYVIKGVNNGINDMKKKEHISIVYGRFDTRLNVNIWKERLVAMKYEYVISIFMYNENLERYVKHEPL